MKNRKLPFLFDFLCGLEGVESALTFVKHVWKKTQNLFFYLVSVSFRRREINLYILKICIVGNMRSPFLLDFSVVWNARDQG